LKTSIIIAVIFAGLLVGGCSGTSYLNLAEYTKEQAEEIINNYPIDEDVGAELTLTLIDSTEITGELLSVRDNTIIICEYYSAYDEELAELKYPILPVRNDKIQILTIEGSNNLWSGLGIGALAGTAVGISFGAIAAASQPEDDEDPNPASTYYLVTVPVGFIVGTLFGAGVGAATSVEEIALSDIPPGYDFSILKSLARYPDDEPEYLRAIK